MMTRTIKVTGWAMGFSPAMIIADVDGETVFSGQVALEEMTDSNQEPDTAPVLFSFEVPLDFDGIKKVFIAVDQAPVRFGYVTANHTEVDMITHMENTGPDRFADVSCLMSGVRDARENVYIDGVLQTPNRFVGAGTWHWVVHPGSSFQHDLIINDNRPV